MYSIWDLNAPRVYPYEAVTVFLLDTGPVIFIADRLG